MGDAMDDGGDDGIDALCELLDADPRGAESPRSDVDALLGCLAPAGALSAGSASEGTKANGASALLGGGALSDRASEALEADLPEPTLSLPDEVRPIPVVLTATFHLRCEIDLKKVAFGIRNAEYNPRKHTSITLRLFDPRCTALVRTSGLVSMVSGDYVNEEDLKRSAKKVARLVQRCGYESQVKFADYQVTSIMCKADLRFPVRLEAVATKWRRNALYEPEFYCGCIFRTRQPRVTYLITAGGKVMITGLRKLENIKEALRRIYSVLHNFQK
mmetsp:Transcript_27809/g.80166  ORF Transcript_27809/g.80166 Transcript_27809/m.80166 type:complete len:274 (-) Transcript_27809:60-881(-)